MNTNNSSGSHDGNRERQLSRHGNRTDNREKRQRSPSDSQNNHGRELFPHKIEGSNRERPQQRALGVVDIHCGFCESNTHNTGCCRRIDLPSGPVERNHGFKRWCPRHLTTSHTMDECPQRWRWLADGRRVLLWLVSDCSAGPAIATNLIDWRSLLEEVPRTTTILSFPWTPEFALEQKRRDAYFHTRKHFEEDPQTTSSRLREKLPWQTENGKEPQFKSFAELKRHAQWECRKLQKPMQSKQRLVAGPQEQPDERRITEPRVKKPENQQVEKQPSKEQGAPGNAMERSRIYPLLRYLISDPLEGCLSNFITGYESCRIELIMSLWTEWLNNKELEIDFIVLAATSCKARDLGLALQASQREQPANNTNEGKVVVQAAAEFLRNNPMPEKRYIIVVDTLFPDLSAWDCSVYNSLQGWIYRSHQRRVWARICLLQPEPMGLWYGVWKAYIRCCSRSIAPEVCEREIEDCGESDEKLVGAVVSELDNISRNMANIRAVIVCPGTKFDAFSEMLPRHVSEAWHVRELSATEQEQDIQRMQQESKPTIFLLPMGIADMTRSIDGLGAILYTDEQERPVYSPTSLASPVQRGGMGAGEIDYCRRILLRYVSRDNVPSLCRLETQKATLPLKKDVFFDPLAMVFLTIGILKSCRLTNLSRFTGWIKPQELCIYVDRLIKLSLLREQRHQYVRTQTDNILERTVAIQSGRGEETFCLMMESDRTDVGFCWLETGISPLRGNHLNEVALDTLGALARLIALFRPRPGLPGMLINFRTTAEGVTDGGNACDSINALLPKYLHSWMDKGAPWLHVLLYDLTAQYESSLVNANSWVRLSPDIMIRPSFLRSVDSDLRRITKRGCFPGTIFNFGHELNTKEHVDACYESVMRRVLDAFPHRLVLIKSVDTANGANISATCIRGFECSTGIVHMIEDNAANTLLLRNLRHVSDKTFAPTFVIYFKLTLLGDNSTIDDLLVVPDTVVMDQLQTPHRN